mgnify:CR=1 FL=1
MPPIFVYCWLRFHKFSISFLRICRIAQLFTGEGFASHLRLHVGELLKCLSSLSPSNAATRAWRHRLRVPCALRRNVSSDRLRSILTGSPPARLDAAFRTTIVRDPWPQSAAAASAATLLRPDMDCRKISAPRWRQTGQDRNPTDFNGLLMKRTAECAHDPFCT